MTIKSLVYLYATNNQFFTSRDLDDFVKTHAKVSPATSTRRLRDLRKEGRLGYDCDGRNSLYEIEYTGARLRFEDWE